MKRILKEDFEKTYQPKLRAHDVIEKTEYFKMNLEEQLQQNNKTLKHYKLSFRLSAIMSIILLLGVIGLGYNQWNLKNKEKGQPKLKEEYYAYMHSINPYVSKDYQYIIRINDNTSMYVYKGVDMQKQVSDYFYVVHFEDIWSNPITISIGSQEINIEETSCGHLTKLSLEEDKVLHFIINVNGLSKEYTIAD